jgi:hypothetical protein
MRATAAGGDLDMKTDAPSEWHWLFNAALNDQLSDAERAQLATVLKSSAEARQLWFLYQDNECSLAELKPRSQMKSPRTGLPWLSWRPLTAAAAGIVFGMLCTSVVFGFGARSVEKVISLLQESFESGPAPLVTGMPQEVNLWSGDYSEIVEKQEGVKPKDGTKMARVLRSDFEGKTSSKPSLQGDLMRVVDVRSFLREASGGEVVITLSALFNAAPFPEAEHYDGAVTLWALGPQFPREENLMDDALAHSVGLCRPLDRDPATWQSTSTRLLLPPGTERVLLKVSFTPVPASSKSLSPLPDHVTFAGHFVDDVRASVTIRKAAPNHRNQGMP